ncbi:MAG: sirohydrochlorin chelatase [Nitrosomonadales bacterium]|nr:sirohydrochlorin chelatase [Nitrosomonadales bacterium]
MNTTILLIGHGSRKTAGNEEILRFAGTWRTHHPGWRIEVCFIEHADMLMHEGLDRAAANSKQVIAVPLIINAAGHVKMDIPEAVDAARARHPGVEFVRVPHLGMGREIHDILRQRIERLLRDLAVPDPRTTGIILLGRGSSDAGANGEIARMARWLFEGMQHDLVDIAFTGITLPRLETVVQRQVKLGMTQIVIQPVYLFTGVLIERIGQQTARLRQSYPHIAFALGGYFGFDEGIYAIADARVRDHGKLTGMLECDGCKYRLAAAHNHHHDHNHAHDHAHSN